MNSEENNRKEMEDSSKASAPPDSINVIDKPKVIEVGGRKVSWNDLLTSLKKERPGMSALQSSRKINLGDVLGSSPAEQEAETHIIRAVEKLKESEDEEEEGENETETDRLIKDITAEDLKTPSSTASVCPPQSLFSGLRSFHPR